MIATEREAAKEDKPYAGIEIISFFLIQCSLLANQLISKDGLQEARGSVRVETSVSILQFSDIILDFSF